LSSRRGRLRPISPNLPSETLADRLASEAAAIGVVLSSQHAARLSHYLDLITQWRRRAALTAVTDPLAAARVHIADSLLILRANIPPGAALVDVGSGAGLPGIPVAIVRPDLRATLLEVEQRKAAFLELAVRELAIAVRVVARRAEEFAHDPDARERYDVVTARAVAPLRSLLELTLPFARVGGIVALLKGPGAPREIRASERAREILGGGEARQIRARLAGGEARLIVVVPKVRATPLLYPRRSGMPVRRPI